VPDEALREFVASRVLSLPLSAPGPGLWTPDGVLQLSGPDGRLIIVEVVDQVSRPLVQDKWRQVRAYAEPRGAIPVLMVPRLTPAIRELADADGINWVDYSGNAHIEAAPVFIHVEGRTGGMAEPRPSVNPFSGRSLNLVRVLLDDPGRPWQQKQLVARSRLSQPRASKVLGALEERALVERDQENRYRVRDADGLLDAWAAAYDYRRNEIVPVHVSGDGMELARAIADRFEAADIIHWFTGLPAAWAYERFARFRLVSVYVSHDPVIVRDQLELREAERGANVHLIAARDQRYEIGHRVVDGLRCVHPTQVYVDLLGLPERAAEAADELRRHVFTDFANER